MSSLAPLLFLSLFLVRPPDKDAVIAIQEIQFKVNGEEAGKWENRIAVGRNRIRVDKENVSVIFDYRLQLFIHIDHVTKRYQISNSETPRAATRRFLVTLAPIVNGMLDRGSNLVSKLNKKKVIHGFPCMAFRLNYPDHLGIETILWTFPHPVFSTAEYRRLIFSLLGSEVPGDAKYIINSILREIWGTPLLIQTSMTLGEDVVEMTSGFSYLEYRKNSGAQVFEIPKGYSMITPEDSPVSESPRPESPEPQSPAPNRP